MDASDLSFEYLRLPYGPETLVHSPNYIKEGYEHNAIRRIFYSVPFDSFEKKQIKDYQTKILSKGLRLPPGWTECETLKHLYATKFDHEKTIQNLRVWQEWLENPISRTLTKEVLALFENGALYIHGRDQQFRPIVICDFAKINFERNKANDIYAAITILLDILVRFCYHPGKVENIVVLVDVRTLSASNFPLSILTNWLTIGNACFPGCLFKVFIIGASNSLKFTWNSVESNFAHLSWTNNKEFIENRTLDKMEFIPLTELYKLQTLISASQLEEKFGGALSNLKNYWPPVASNTEQFSFSNREKYQNVRTQDPNLYTFNTPINKEYFDKGLTSYQMPGERYTSAARIERTNYDDVPTFGNLDQTSSSKRIFDGRGTSIPKSASKGESLLQEMRQFTVQNFGQNNNEYLSNHSFMNNLGKEKEPERAKRSTPPPSEGRITRKLQALNPFAAKREDEKKVVDKKKPSSSEQSLFDMIISEDKYIKNNPQPVVVDVSQIIANGSNRSISAERKFKKELQIDTDLGYESPGKNLRVNTTQEKLQSYSPFKQKEATNNALLQEFLRVPDHLEKYKSAYKHTQERDDLIEYNQKAGEWYVPRRNQEIPIEQEDDKDDDDTNYCGICVSHKTRKRNA